MSAPDTNVKEQQSKHKTPLVGMAWMVAWAAALLVALLVYLSWQGNEPGNGTPIDVEMSAQ